MIEQDGNAFKYTLHAPCNSNITTSIYTPASSSISSSIPPGTRAQHIMERMSEVQLTLGREKKSYMHVNGRHQEISQHSYLWFKNAM